MNNYKVIKNIILKGQRASVLKVTEIPTMHCIFCNADWAFYQPDRNPLQIAPNEKPTNIKLLADVKLARSTTL